MGYAKKALASPSFPSVTYSKALRHAHLSMAVGAFAMIGFVQAARRTEDMRAKKAFMNAHKNLGMLMLVAAAARAVFRAKSAIPPSFKGPFQSLEIPMHKLFYALLFIMPVSGIAAEYTSGAGLNVGGMR